MGDWCTIESDPGVFSELIRSIGSRESDVAARPNVLCAGVVNAQVDELVEVSTEHLSAIRPHGLIFLFKWQPGSTGGPAPIQHDVPGLFFAKQVIQNACATQAILCVLLNSAGLDIGPALRDFRDFTLCLEADMRGLAISNQELVRTVHNSFSRQELFTMEQSPDDDDSDAFHFVAFVPHDGRLYELDGLQSGPIDHGAFTGEWHALASEVVSRRIATYAGSEIRFNLLAIVPDALMKSETREAALRSRGELSPEDALALQECMEDVATERHRRAAAATENIRRRHNYIPVFLELLRQAAAKGHLPAMTAAAAARGHAKALRAAANGKSGLS